MTTIFLWADIILMQVTYICPIQAMTRSLMLISIAFLWSHSKVSGICKFLVQKHSHTKSRQIRELIIFCYCNICINPSNVINFPCNHHVKNLLYCFCHNRSMAYNLYPMSSLHDLCRIGSCISPIIMCFLPFRLNVHIVICWSSPNI